MLKGTRPKNVRTEPQQSKGIEVLHMDSNFHPTMGIYQDRSSFPF